MIYQNLVVDNYGHIRHIVINRESKLNALNKLTLSELHNAIIDALTTDTVRGIVITGAGNKAFVAGADIAEFTNLNAVQGRSLAHEGQKSVFDLIHNADKPIIAAINGYALGGGLELALACHMRVAATHAKLGLPEVSLGLIPGYGGTQRLPQLVGRGKALELILTGDMISAHEALELGVVNHVVEQTDLLTKTDEILQRIAARSRTAVSAAIKAVNASLGPIDRGFETEVSLFGDCFGTPDFKEGVSAFLEKRKPNF